MMLERPMQYDLNKIVELMRMSLYTDDPEQELDNQVIAFINRYGEGSVTWLFNKLKDGGRVDVGGFIDRLCLSDLPMETINERESLLIHLSKGDDIKLRYTAISALGNLDTPDGYAILKELKDIETSRMINALIDAHLRGSRHGRKI